MSTASADALAVVTAPWADWFWDEPPAPKWEPYVRPVETIQVEGEVL